MGVQVSTWLAMAKSCIVKSFVISLIAWKRMKGLSTQDSSSVLRAGLLGPLEFVLSDGVPFSFTEQSIVVTLDMESVSVSHCVSVY